jgi:hypothetical protein
MKKFLVFSIIIISFLKGFSQDTIVVLQYNLLNYGNFTSYCTSYNNNVAKKDGYIKTIINYIKPDIFSVNEIVANAAMMEHLLGKLNETWTNKYKRPDFIHNNTPYTANTVFYNSEKLIFYSQEIVQTYLRDVNLYKFYYNSSNLGNGGDTTFLICVVAHLKAGHESYDENKRKIMAENIMKFIDDYDKNNNYLLMGDFNLYTNQEGAWRLFTDYSDPVINFNDPVNKSGSWHNNQQYRYYHTQSTHSDDNGCAVPGGLDDRFDFILISDNIKFGNKKVKYIPSSYWAVGQDGKHYNKGLLDSPVNTTVPSDVLTALYKNSDHLPVKLKLEINNPVGINELFKSWISNVTFKNPVDDILKLKINSESAYTTYIAVYDISGRVLIRKHVNVKKGNNVFELMTDNIDNGFYILQIDNKNGFCRTYKFIKM